MSTRARATLPALLLLPLLLLLLLELPFLLLLAALRATPALAVVATGRVAGEEEELLRAKSGNPGEVKEENGSAAIVSRRCDLQSDMCA